MIAGTIFTNENHQITFVDSILEAILCDGADCASHIVGSPMNELFGLSLEQYSRLASSNSVRALAQMPLDLIGIEGYRIPSLVTAEVNTNHDGTFMGMDYSIQIAPDNVGSSDVTPISDPLVDEVMRYYFKRQLEGLYHVATNWGGKHLGQYLNNVVNQTSQLHGWGVAMNAESIQIQNDSMPIEVYRGLLIKAGTYMTKLLGWRIISQQVEQINQKTNPTTFDYIDANWLEH